MLGATPIEAPSEPLSNFYCSNGGSLWLRNYSGRGEVYIRSYMIQTKNLCECVVNLAKMSIYMHR